MRTIKIYNDASESDCVALRCADRAVDLVIMAQDLFEHIRTKTKHGSLCDDKSAAYQEVRDWLVQYMREEGIDLEWLTSI